MMSPADETNTPASVASRRSRRRGPRCKTGCSTCRIRRVKCDEAKPWCARCKSSGRTCDGYEHYLTAAKAGTITSANRTLSGISDENSLKYDHPADVIVAATERTIAQAGTFFQPLSSIGTAFERRAFSYFQSRTSLALSGYFKCSIWDSLILRLSYEERSIWHSIVALSTLHEEFSSDGDVYTSNSQNQRHRLLGLQQYNHAIGEIKQLLKSKTSGAIDAVLISCLMFIYYELIQSNYGMAVQHLIRGLRIFCAVPVSDLRKSVSKLFLRIVTQSMFLGAAHVKPHDIPIPRSHTKQPFTSPSDARDSLDEIFILAYPFVFAAPYKFLSPEQISDQYRELSSLLAEWEVQLQTLITQQGKSFSARDVAATEILPIHCQCLSIFLRLASGEPAASTIPAFYRVVSLVRQFLRVSNLRDANESPSEEPRPFMDYMFDLGVIGPLFYTAVKCPSANIGSMAALLLHHPRIPSREGIWGQEMAVKLAQRITMAEKELLLDRAAFGEEGLDGSSAGEILNRMPRAGPTWKFKRSRSGGSMVRRYSNYGIEKPTGFEGSFAIVVGDETTDTGGTIEDLLTC